MDDDWKGAVQFTLLSAALWKRIFSPDVIRSISSKFFHTALREIMHNYKGGTNARLYKRENLIFKRTYLVGLLFYKIVSTVRLYRKITRSARNRKLQDYDYNYMTIDYNVIRWIDARSNDVVRLRRCISLLSRQWRVERYERQRLVLFHADVPELRDGNDGKMWFVS